jgi:hypothetical protein
MSLDDGKTMQRIHGFGGGLCTAYFKASSVATLPKKGDAVKLYSVAIDDAAIPGRPIGDAPTKTSAIETLFAQSVTEVTDGSGEDWYSVHAGPQGWKPVKVPGINLAM